MPGSEGKIVIPELPTCLSAMLSACGRHKPSSWPPVQYQLINLARHCPYRAIRSSWEPHTNTLQAMEIPNGAEQRTSSYAPESFGRTKKNWCLRAPKAMRSVVLQSHFRMAQHWSAASAALAIHPTSLLDRLMSLSAMATPGPRNRNSKQPQTLKIISQAPRLDRRWLSWATPHS